MQHNLFKKLSREIANLYSTRLLLLMLLAVAAFFWLFNFSHVPFSNPSLMKVSGHDGFLDVMPFYSAQEAFSILGRYSAEGREIYLKFLAVDFIFIPVYSLGFALLFTCAIQSKFGKGDAKLWLNLLPLGIGLFDCLENICILGMLFIFPETNLALGTISGLATLCKNILMLMSLLCLGYLGIGLLIYRLNPLHHNNNQSSSTRVRSNP